MTHSRLLATLLRRVMAPAEAGGGGGGASGGDDDTAVLDVDPDDGATGSDGDDGAAHDGAGEGADGELELTLGDEVAEDTDEATIEAAMGENERGNAAWARQRKQLKDLQRQTRDQAARLQQLETQNAAAAAPAAIVVGEKPTMEGCDFDADKYAEALDAWHDRREKAAAQQAEQQRAQQQAQKTFEDRITAVDTAAKTLKLAANDAAVESFEAIFSPLQRGLIMGVPDDPKTSAQLRNVLGKNPGKARELAAIKDGAKFIYAVAKLEAQMKAAPRRTPPAPDTPVRSAASSASAVDNTEDKLREEARSTGNYSKLMDYQRQKGQKAAKRA